MLKTLGIELPSGVELPSTEDIGDSSAENADNGSADDGSAEGTEENVEEEDEKEAGIEDLIVGTTNDKNDPGIQYLLQHAGKADPEAFRASLRHRRDVYDVVISKDIVQVSMVSRESKGIINREPMWDEATVQPIRTKQVAEVTYNSVSLNTESPFHIEWPKGSICDGLNPVSLLIYFIMQLFSLVRWVDNRYGWDQRGYIDESSSLTIQWVSTFYLLFLAIAEYRSQKHLDKVAKATEDGRKSTIAGEDSSAAIDMQIVPSSMGEVTPTGVIEAGAEVLSQRVQQKLSIKTVKNMLNNKKLNFFLTLFTLSLRILLLCVGQSIYGERVVHISTKGRRLTSTSDCDCETWVEVKTLEVKAKVNAAVMWCDKTYFEMKYGSAPKAGPYFKCEKCKPPPPPENPVGAPSPSSSSPSTVFSPSPSTGSGPGPGPGPGPVSPSPGDPVCIPEEEPECTEPWCCPKCHPPASTADDECGMCHPRFTIGWAFVTFGLSIDIVLTIGLGYKTSTKKRLGKITKKGKFQYIQPKKIKLARLTITEYSGRQYKIYLTKEDARLAKNAFLDSSSDTGGKELLLPKTRPDTTAIKCWSLACVKYSCAAIYAVIVFALIVVILNKVQQIELTIKTMPLCVTSSSSSASGGSGGGSSSAASGGFGGGGHHIGTHRI